MEEVPLLIKAIAYIEATKDEYEKKAEFIEELDTSNSSITLFVVHFKLAKFQETYSENMKYQNIMKVLSDKIDEMVFDETNNKSIQKLLKKNK